MSNDNQFLQAIQVWAGLAWADGVVVPAEARAMERLIAASGLSEADTATALGYLRRAVPLETAGLRGLHESARQGIYRAAARLARVDHEVAESERAFLTRLRVGLQLDERTAAEIEAEL